MHSKISDPNFSDEENLRNKKIVIKSLSIDNADMKADIADAALELQKENPKGFTFESVLGDQSSQDKIINKILNVIEKRGLNLVDFSNRDKEEVFSFTFPPKDAPAQENIKFCYLDGAAYETILINYNDLNRPIKLDAAIKYAIDKLTGNWHEDTHEGIAFTWEPELQDGQHRSLGGYLASRIIPNLKILYPIWFNRDPKNRDYVNTGLIRKSSDKLVMKLKGNNPDINFDNDRYSGVPARVIYATVCAMPSLRNKSETLKIQFAHDNLDTIVEVIKKLLQVRTISFSASWAGVFVDALMIFGSEHVLPLVERFSSNNWIQYPPTKDGKIRVDPLFSLLDRLNKNKTASRLHKLTAPLISSCVVYAIRKALLKESVTCKGRGTRFLARYEKFFKDEGEDFKQLGTKSKLLKRYSVAAESDKRDKNEEVEEENNETAAEAD